MTDSGVFSIPEERNPNVATPRKVFNTLAAGLGLGGLTIAAYALGGPFTAAAVAGPSMGIAGVVSGRLRHPKESPAPKAVSPQPL